MYIIQALTYDRVIKGKYGDKIKLIIGKNSYPLSIFLSIFKFSARNLQINIPSKIIKHIDVSMKKTYKDPLNKTQIIQTLADETNLSKKEVSSVLNTLSDLIGAHIKPRSGGVFKLPGLMKVQVVKKLATKARKGVTNPFRPGETMDVAARPASRKLKVVPLKGLKDMASGN